MLTEVDVKSEDIRAKPEGWVQKIDGKYQVNVLTLVGSQKAKTCYSGMQDNYSARRGKSIFLILFIAYGNTVFLLHNADFYSYPIHIQGGSGQNFPT